MNIFNPELEQIQVNKMTVRLVQCQSNVIAALYINQITYYISASVNKLLIFVYNQ